MFWKDTQQLFPVASQVLRSPTRHTLNSMVSHFQTLFDVKSLQGVYPRMNELYTRLGEATNAMRNLRDILELGDPQMDACATLMTPSDREA